MVATTRRAASVKPATASAAENNGVPDAAPSPNPNTPADFFPAQECDHESLTKLTRAVPSTDGPVSDLKIQSYPACALVNRTRDEWVVNADHESLLDKAGKSFVKLYKKHTSGDPDEQKEFVDTWSRAETTAILMKLMRSLDQAFFFSTMTKPYGGREQPLVRLVVCDGAADARRMKNSGLGQRYGFAQLLTPAEAGGTSLQLQVHTKITTWAKGGRPTMTCRSLTEMTQTLVHEMCHAYLDLFACRSGNCAKNRVNTFGFMGHGLAFQTLSAAVAVEVGKWDEALRGDFSNRSCSGSSYCVHDWKAEREKYDSAKDQGQLAGLRGWVMPDRRSGTMSWIAKSSGRVILRNSARVVKYQSNRGRRCRHPTKTQAEDKGPGNDAA
ncbi:hypothetical protein ACHAQA_000376 [Verticillium albo-atrum]